MAARSYLLDTNILSHGSRRDDKLREGAHHLIHFLLKGQTRMKRLVLLSVLAVVAAGASQASQPSSNDLDTLLRRAVEQKRVPAVVAMVADSRGVVYEQAAGVSKDAICPIASMTKPITSVAVMQLVEAGRVQLDAPAATYVPELSAVRVVDGAALRPAKSPVTVRQLLTHTAGFGYEFLNREVLDLVAKKQLPTAFAGDDGFLKAPLLFDPGTRWQYGINTDWLGRVVERVSGQRVQHVLLDRSRETGWRRAHEQYAAVPGSRSEDADRGVRSGSLRVESPLGARYDVVSKKSLNVSRSECVYCRLAEGTHMEIVIANLLRRFEDGKITRRQLIQSLAMVAAASPAAAAAQEAAKPAPPIPPAFEPTGWKTVALDHISFAVGDYRKSAAFYRDLMGWTVRNDNGASQASLDINGLGSIIIRNRRQAAPDAQSTGPQSTTAQPATAPAGASGRGQGSARQITGVINHISWGIEPWDTEKVEAELKRRGLNPRPDMVGDNFKSFHVLDPDGWDLQISNATRNR
jgi:catechol 2,3-dioxygenase-like lactoylglutathione lyase family enzyme